MDIVLVSCYCSMLIPALSFRFAEPVPVLFYFPFRCTMRMRTGAIATVNFILTVYFLNCRLRAAHTSIHLAYFLSYSILRNHDGFRTSTDFHLDSAKQDMSVHCTKQEGIIVQQSAQIFFGNSLSVAFNLCFPSEDRIMMT